MTREITELHETVWDYYARHGRELPWRQPEPHGGFDAYKILVSEIMLQQTQVSRVISKYVTWLERFPDVESLAKAPLSAVLAEWSGLGYNRRAKFLHEAAARLSQAEAWTFDDLVVCKGIGPNTAAAVLVYAYNRPLVFVETNIRTVYIHHFFRDRDDVSDRELLPFIERSLDREHPREWYWALMDYGTHLKATVGNVSRASRHYTKQSAFAGSKRYVRGQVLRVLQTGSMERHKLATHIGDERLDSVLRDLTNEGLITEQGGAFRLG